MSEITGFQRPHFSQDSMLKGIFRFFQHDHFFRAVDVSRTEMRDRLSSPMPFWLMGTLSERLVMRSRLIHLLELRNNLIKETAQA
jgi:hypothetical protein